MNIVFSGASPVLRHVRLRSSPLGPGREEVDYRDARADPLDGKVSPLLVTGNTWGSPPASWPESGFVGEMYAGFLEPGRRVSLVVADASPWVYRCTGLRDGSAVPGVIATDVDHFYAAMIHPANVQILAHSPIPLSMGQTELGAFYSDMTYYTAARSGAGVLDTGTTNWIPALARDHSGAAPRRGPRVRTARRRSSSGSPATSCARSAAARPATGIRRPPTGGRSPAIEKPAGAG
jgi:hypothetical protein